jgi:hypothetical protein
MAESSPLSSESALRRLLEEMAAPAEGVRYYAITLLSPDSESITYDVMSHWVDFEYIAGRRHEVRKARPVDPIKIYNLYRKIGRHPVFVTTEAHVTAFLTIGGTGIIETELAHERFPDAVEPGVAVQDGLLGYRSLESVAMDDTQALRRAPTAKRRMAVLNRDGRRCKICGRRPDDHEDLELRVHHVRPWSEGGLTEEQNLVTLCHTCHNGLDPHFDYTLFAYVQPSRNPHPDRDYEEGVARYRALVAKRMAIERDDPPDVLT